jgi:diguanylate cyclase (GGDEF)-like protein
MLSTSLQRRIAVVFAGLLVLVMGFVLALVHNSSERIVHDEARRELAIGANVFKRLLEQNQRQLETAATVLSGDFAFREAIATQDGPTVHSVIGNHARRIHAQVMMVAGTDERLVATTQSDGAGAGAGEQFPFHDLLAVAETNGRSAGMRQMRNGHLYQVVLVPINAPTRIAWVLMGFRVDDNWARDLSTLSGLAVHIVRVGHRAPELLATSLEAARQPAFENALFSGDDTIDVGNDAYQSVRVPLDGDIQAVLQLPVAQVRAPFSVLLARLLMVLGAGAVLFAIGSTMLARRIVRPINELSAAARRIAMGDYGRQLPPLSRDEIGQLATSFAHMRDGIASREEHIARLAYVDNLTDLPNRTRFLETFAAIPQGASVVVAVLNIDRFALINNALGYPVGDRLLRAIAGRLAGLVPAGGVVARLWADQFAFLLRDFDNERARAFAQSVLDTLKAPITLDGQRLDISASVSIAMYPNDGKDASTLLRRAEQAMAGAKRRHTDIAFVADIGSEPAPEQLSLIGDMREAMANGDFLLHYQPKLELHTGRIVAVEALLRWQHPERGMIPPVRFIPFAEQTGFIREITPWVIESVIRQLSLWQSIGLDITVSANLSALDLLDPRLCDSVRELLARYGVPASRLCLEITESALMDDPTLALAHLADLSDLGLKLSIDDYGVGQASLAYIKTLPVNELKLDRSFVTAVNESPKNAAIVTSTIMLSHALGLTVVAEGVETPAELQWLANQCCDVVQGYGIARPMPAQAIPDWISSFTLPAEVARLHEPCK